MTTKNIQQTLVHDQVQDDNQGGLPKWMALKAREDSHYAAELQDWLECKDFILGMKGIHVGSLPINTDSLRHCKVSVNSLVDSTKNRNDKIANQICKHDKYWIHAIDAALDMANAVEAQITSDIIKLNNVNLNDKRKVLRHMQIIPTAVAAAYLGISSDALNNMKKYEQALFGKHYAGGHCYSMAELNLIACNPHWSFSIHLTDFEHLPTEFDATALDQVVMVDEQVACAFTNMSRGDLFEQVPHTMLTRRPYRLADLEKVRTATLIQEAACRRTTGQPERSKFLAVEVL